MDWVLMQAREFYRAKEVMIATRSALQDLIEGRTVARLYGSQKPAWYEYKKEQFEKKAQKYLEKIEKLEGKE